MGTIADQIEKKITGTFQDNITDAKVNKIIKQMAQDMFDVDFNRVYKDKKDVNNNDFAKTTPPYRKTKRNFIKGQPGKSKSLRKLIRTRVNPYRAERVTDHLRLTGLTLFRWRHKVTKIEKTKKTLTIQITMFIQKSREEIAGYIQKKRKFFGWSGKPKYKKQRDAIASAALSKIFKSFK